MRKILIFAFFALIGSCYNSDEGNKTTTVGPDSTTASPIPKIPEEAQLLSFEIMNSNKTVCSMFNFTATVTINTLNNTQTVDKIEIPLNKLNTKMENNSSFCNLNSTKLVLDVTTLNGTFELSFQLNHANSYYELALIQLKSVNNTFTKNDTSIRVEDNKSYLCLNHPEFKLIEKIQNEQELKHEAHLSATDLRIDAFRSNEDTAGFRAPQECKYDFPNNDFVPLAVGCALISLVFIVLIAYIVGRKRSRRLTYQSV